MTIPEAIVTLREIIMCLKPPMPYDELTALNLGIEALKAVEESRRIWGDRGVPLLPGETEK